MAGRNNHSPVVAKQAFSRMEYLIFRRLWRCSKRRHPNKGVEWVRKKYFHALGTFCDPSAVPQSDDSMGLLDLYDLSGTEIQRHNKVKGAYNPLDLIWEQYGEELRQGRMAYSVRYWRQWATLYLSQGGLCAHCGCALTDETGWHDHHLEYRMLGGSDSLSNRVLPHPNCHQQAGARW